MDGIFQPMCSYFQRNGSCRYGDACRFSHDAAASPSQRAAFSSRVWSHQQASTSGRDASPPPFRVMSYNTLADTLAHEHAPELYKACPKWCLNWSMRGPGILAEITHWDPDIGLLQEVDHVAQFQGYLQQRGYETAYVARTGGRTDGCLTFWRRERFAALRVDPLQMRRLGLKDNVALLVLLGDKERPPDAPALLVGNTHLLFNPKRGDIKVAQARTILSHMAALQAEAGRPTWVMLGGDFNSVPGSAMYRFVAGGELDCGAEDRRNMSGQLESRGALRRLSQGRSPQGGSIGNRVGPAPQQTLHNGLPIRPGHAWPGHHSSSSFPRGGSLPDNDMCLTQAQDSLLHSSSVPSELAAHTPSSTTSASDRVSPSAPRLYTHSDAGGRQFWSPTPPPGPGQGAGVVWHPFYYSPMQVEEPAPDLAATRHAPSTPQRARQVTMGSWDAEQLMIAVGQPAAGAAPVRTTHAGFPVLKPRSKGLSGADLDPGAWIARHPLAPLCSAYSQVLGGEPAFTSCHGRVIDTLDYIWFTPLASRQASAGDASDCRSADNAAMVHANGTASVNTASTAQCEHAPHAEAAFLRDKAAPQPAPAEEGVKDSSGTATSSGGGGAPDWALVATRVAMVPPLSAMRGGMPSPDYPSDHISLVAEFSARPVQAQARTQPSSGEKASHPPPFRPVHQEQQQRRANQHLRFDEHEVL